jgi:PadR family transcriptional regulator, regulatory protein PadR
MINEKIKRGSAELAILAVLAAEPLHGYEISRRIEARTRGALRFTLASLYPLLYRLEKRGWIRGAWETTRGGRRRRCYRLTPKGKKQLAPLRQQWRIFFKALDRLAGVANA